MHEDWNYDMHDGIGWGWIPMAIMMLLVWGSLIWLGIALLRRTGACDDRVMNVSPAPLPETPQQILAERLARGEIEPDDYPRLQWTRVAPAVVARFECCWRR